MNNFEQRRSYTENANEFNKKTEPKTETFEDLNIKRDEKLNQMREIKDRIESDQKHMDHLNTILGLEDKGDTPSISKAKERLSILNNDFSEIEGTMKGIDMENFDRKENSDPNVATKGNYLWKKSSRDMQESYEKQKKENNAEIRDLADRFHEGKDKASDEEWVEHKKSREFEKDKRLQDIQSGLDDFANKTREKREREQKTKDGYFKNFDSQKNHDDIQNTMKDFPEIFGNNKESKHMEGYENTIMGMNENIGYNPIDAEKYKTQLDKEGAAEGWSKEKVEEEWQRIKNNPNAKWI